MINHMIPVVPVLSYGYLPDPNFSSIKISLANNNRCQNDTTFNTTINRKDFASNLISKFVKYFFRIPAWVSKIHRKISNSRLLLRRYRNIIS